MFHSARHILQFQDCFTYAAYFCVNYKQELDLSDANPTVHRIHHVFVVVYVDKEHYPNTTYTLPTSSPSSLSAPSAPPKLPTTTCSVPHYQLLQLQLQLLHHAQAGHRTMEVIGGDLRFSPLPTRLSETSLPSATEPPAASYRKNPHPCQKAIELPTKTPQRTRSVPCMIKHPQKHRRTSRPPPDCPLCGLRLCEVRVCRAGRIVVGYIAKSPTTSQVATATGATGALMEAPSYIRAVWRASRSVNMGGYRRSQG